MLLGLDILDANFTFFNSILRKYIVHILIVIESPPIWISQSVSCNYLIAFHKCQGHIVIITLWVFYAEIGLNNAVLLCHANFYNVVKEENV